MSEPSIPISEVISACIADRSRTSSESKKRGDDGNKCGLTRRCSGLASLAAELQSLGGAIWHRLQPSFYRGRSACGRTARRSFAPSEPHPKHHFSGINVNGAAAKRTRSAPSQPSTVELKIPRPNDMRRLTRRSSGRCASAARSGYSVRSRSAAELGR